MTMPVPVTQPQASGYTHRTWLDEMADALGHVAAIYRDFDVMLATLNEVRAGKTQLALVGDCQQIGHDVMTRGVSLVKETDARYLPVFEAINRAGGQQEVAKDKNYHQRG